MWCNVCGKDHQQTTSVCLPPSPQVVYPTLAVGTLETDWERFFKQHKDNIIYGHEDMVSFTTEELYQAIKARLCAEIKVALPNTGFTGVLRK